MTYQMEVNGIEKDFLEQIREARAEDIRTVVEYLHKLKEKEDKKGRLTPVAILTAVITEELILNGMIKWRNIEENEEQGGRMNSTIQTRVKSLEKKISALTDGMFTVHFKDGSKTMIYPEEAIDLCLKEADKIERFEEDPRGSSNGKMEDLLNGLLEEGEDYE